MRHSRRQFLHSSLGGTALLSAGLGMPGFLTRAAQAAANSTTENILVVLQLSGGNDGLNTVVPYADDAYGRNRFVLRLPAGQVLKIDDYVGLHPQMQGLAELLEAGHLGVIQGVGYPNPDRSHFRSMDIWHSAQPQEPKPADGWLGRYVQQTPSSAGQDVPALHLGSEKLPLALASQRQPVPSIDSLESFRLRSGGGALPTSALERLASVSRPKEDGLLAFVQRSTITALSSSTRIQQVIESPASPVSYPGFGLARKLRNVAHLIDAGLKTRIYYVSLGGFDTHANQAEGHAALVRELSQSVAAFVADLGQRGHLNRVLLTVFSEFGRRVRENGSQGTDHGAAAPMFLAGGQVQSGLIGKHPSLTDLDREGDLKFHTDFRQVYATLLDRWLGCSSQDVLGQKFEHVPIFRAT